MNSFDVAAYIWPAYTGDEPRTRIFWDEGIGEWQSVKNSVKKFEGHDWPRKPLWGYVNEADPYVMEMEINAAADHGVNVFIYDWYWYDRRPFLENCLNDGYLRAQNNDRVKFCLMWANHDANTLWDIRNAEKGTTIWQGAVDQRELDRVSARICERYLCRDNYYRINGRPVFMIYDTENFINGLGGMDNAARGIESIKNTALKQGLPEPYMMMIIWNNRGYNLSGVDGAGSKSTAETIRTLGYDGLTHYQFVHFTGIDRDYSEILESVKQEWARIDRDYAGIDYFPHISLGWDNNPRYHSFRPGIVKGNTPEAVEKGFRMAKEYALEHDRPDRPRLVTVNSWNEWTETSYLEPDDLYGYGYLEAIKRVFVDN